MTRRPLTRAPREGDVNFVSDALTREGGRGGLGRGRTGPRGGPLLGCARHVIGLLILMPCGRLELYTGIGEVDGGGDTVLVGSRC